MASKTLKTDLSLDCLFHVGGDESKLENKKRFIVAQSLMNENMIQPLINNTAEDNLLEPNADQLYGDIDSNTVMTAEV